MEPKVNIITLGVPDLAAARRFYVDGLGWTAVFEVPGDIVFVQVGHGLLLGLWGADNLERDIDPAGGTPRDATGPAPFTMAHNVASDDEVAEVLAAAAAGATVLKKAQVGEVGFVHGFFADPAGFRWEVAHNPGLVFGADGTITFGPPG